MVAIVTYIAGLGAGLLAAAISIVPLIYFFMWPYHSFALHDSLAAPLVVYAISACLIAWIVSGEARARAISRRARELRDVLAKTRTATWEWDVDADRLRWSRDARRMLDLSPGEPRGLDQLRDVVHPADHAKLVETIRAAVDAKSTFEHEVRTALVSDGWRWIRLEGHAQTRLLGKATRVSGLAQDVTIRRRADERQRFLAEVTKAVAEPLDYEQAVVELARLAVPDLGDWCTVDILDDDGRIRNVAAAHADHSRAELVEDLRRSFPLVATAPRGAPHVLRTGQPELYIEMPDELLAEFTSTAAELDAIRALGISSAMVVPLRARGRTLGALTLALAGTARRFDADDLALAQDVALRAGLIIDNARLHRQEREARADAELRAGNMERLQALTAHLSAAATPTDVAKIVVQESRDALGAKAAWVSVLTDDESELGLLAANGYEPAFVDRYRRIPVGSDHMLAVVVHDAQARWIGSDEDGIEARPEIAAANAATRSHAVAYLPLTGAARPFGCLCLRFDSPREFGPEDRSLIGAFAGLCAESLERSRLYEQERRARADAEGHRGELEFLSEVSQTLSSTLDLDTLLDKLLMLAVPRLADAISIFLLAVKDDVLVRAASAHVDPVKSELLRELRGIRLDVDMYPEGPLARTIRGGESVALPRIAPEMLASLSQDEHQLRVLESLGMRAWHSMPLLVQGETIGMLTLATIGSRQFEEHDLELAREFGSRAALALANAREYGEERKARDMAERASARLEHLHAVTAALAQAVTARDAAKVIVQQAGAAVGAAAAAVQLITDEAMLEVVAASGHLEELISGYGGMSLSQQVPAAEAIRDEKLLWFASAAELAVRYPDHARIRPRLGAVGFVPLVGWRKPLGLLTFSFEGERHLDDDDRALLMTLGGQCGQALERAQLYEREQEARKDAEEASRRLDQLQSIVEVGLAARSIDELVNELLSHVRQLLGADGGTILLIDEASEDLRIRAAVGVDPEQVTDVRVPVGQGIAGRIAATGKPVIVNDLSETTVVSGYLRDRGGSLIGVPLSVEGRVQGVMHVESRQRDAFSEADLELLERAAERVSLAFERTMIYEREHEIAVTLQRSVLPGELPDVDHLELAVRYFPGRSELEVGGDWYDVIPLDHNRVGFAIGDVVGKGVLAASTMAQLRNALRIYALEGLRPSSVLARLSEFAKTTGMPFATVLYLLLDCERGTCRYASAGHPPALLLRRGWHAVYLEGGRSTPVGTGLETRYPQASVEIGPGDTVLLYTDGLVESRTMPLGEGMERLSAAVEAGPEPLEELLDYLAEVLSVDTREDDVAMIALRLQPVNSLTLSLSAKPSSLPKMRRAVGTWLERAGVGGSQAHDILLACSEACSNAIQHAADDPAPDFEVICTRENGEISLVVRDFGSWRESRPTETGGFGLKLMEGLMDSVEIASKEGGTEVRLRQRVAPASA